MAITDAFSTEVTTFDFYPDLITYLSQKLQVKTQDVQIFLVCVGLLFLVFLICTFMAGYFLGRRSKNKQVFSVEESFAKMSPSAVIRTECKNDRQSRDSRIRGKDTGTLVRSLDGYQGNSTLVRDRTTGPSTSGQGQGKQVYVVQTVSKDGSVKVSSNTVYSKCKGQYATGSKNTYTPMVDSRTNSHIYQCIPDVVAPASFGLMQNHDRVDGSYNTCSKSRDVSHKTSEGKSPHRETSTQETAMTNLPERVENDIPSALLEPVDEETGKRPSQLSDGNEVYLEVMDEHNILPLPPRSLIVSNENCIPNEDTTVGDAAGVTKDEMHNQFCRHTVLYKGSTKQKTQRQGEGHRDTFLKHKPEKAVVKNENIVYEVKFTLYLHVKCCSKF